MPKKPVYPVKKVLTFTPEMWERVRAWRFMMHIDTEAEAVRRLIDRGLGTWTPPVWSERS